MNTFPLPALAAAFSAAIALPFNAAAAATLLLAAGLGFVLHADYVLRRRRLRLPRRTIVAHANVVTCALPQRCECQPLAA